MIPSVTFFIVPSLGIPVEVIEGTNQGEEGVMFQGKRSSLSFHERAACRSRTSFRCSAVSFFCIAAEILSRNVVLGGWVDPDTKPEFRSAHPLTPGDNREYQLVSDVEYCVVLNAYELLCSALEFSLTPFGG